VEFVLGLVKDSDMTPDEVINEIVELLGAHDTTGASDAHLRAIAVQVIDVAGVDPVTPPLPPPPVAQRDAHTAALAKAPEPSHPQQRPALASGRPTIKPEAAGRAGGEDVRVRELRELMQGLVPTASSELCRYIIHRHGACDEAVELLLSSSLEEIEEEMLQAAARDAVLAAAEASAEKSARKSVVNRYAQVAEKSDPDQPTKLAPPRLPYSGSRKEAVNAKVLRYREGEAVGYTREKFAVEDKPEWDGGSRGRVKTKGKRGPGFV